MSHRITVQPSGRQFFAAPGQTILEAALAAGVTLPYSCKNGACSSCKGLVVSGDVQQGPHQPGILTADEVQAGQALFCCATPMSDLTVQARVVQGIDGIDVRKIPVRVHQIERLTEDVIVLTLQLPANQVIRFNAGQYLEFVMRNGVRRSYSMASAPHRGGFVDLHIRHMPGGVFTDQLFGITSPAIQVRDILRCEMPLGSFFLREDSQKPIVLLASGTGFAPVKAIVEHLVHSGIQRHVHLYWGGRRPQDLYLNSLAQEWARDLPDFRYIPVISDALPEDQWTGRTGWVHEAVIQDLPNLSDFEVYACGAPAMVAAAQRDFTRHCYLPDDAFFADAFTSAADLSAVVD